MGKRFPGLRNTDERKIPTVTIAAMSAAFLADRPKVDRLIIAFD